jgi:glycosyltransferase involved in cell wall biosynthesis
MHYRERYNAETVYVANGAALRERRQCFQIREWGIEPGNYILFLGRFSPEKNCHSLIEAYKEIDTDVKLVLAGDPGLPAPMRRICADMRVTEFASSTTFLEKLLRNC